MSDTEIKTDTRASLIQAGLHLFGQNGFEATSTRQLAARAGTNVASIAYHFGSKAGLRAACAMAVVSRVSKALDGAGVLDAPNTGGAALAKIENLVGALVDLIVASPEAADMAAFMIREATAPGEVADTVYLQFIEPRHKAICRLWATVTGRDPDDAEVKLAVFALVGQVVYFRIASPFVLRRMSWNAVGPDETRQISALIIANLHDTIERQRT